MTEANVCHEQPLDSLAKLDNTQTPLSIRLYLGGSFDPPHHAHLALLKHAYTTLAALSTSTDYAKKGIAARFLPTARSPLKTTSTDPKQRLRMLQLACVHLNQQAAFINATIKPMTTIEPINSTSDPNANIDRDANNAAIATLPQRQIPQNPPAPFAICEQELWQPPPTYTIHTLQALRAKYPKSSLIFILGADSVASFSQWRDGARLTEFAHLWIMPRDALQTPEAIRALLPTPMQHQATQNLQVLQQTTHGHIYLDTQQVAAISSSQIRQAIAQQHFDFVKSALPHSVYSYIMANQLYPC